MRVKFWGARGSIPTPMGETELREKIRLALMGAVGVDLTNNASVDEYLNEKMPAFIMSMGGGNTSCVEVRAGDNLFILDCGSGVRLLGNELMKEDGFRTGKGEGHIFQTHTHWDHIQGFPFFTPVFIPGNKFTFYSPFDDLRERFEGQQVESYFPVPISYMQATRVWKKLDPAQSYSIGGATIRLKELSHPGRAFAYRIDYQGKSVVYATDGEYKKMDEDSIRPYVDFYRDADLLIFDAQFSFQQVIEDKRDWGHSSPKQGAEIAYKAGVKRLALTHHDPMATDEKLWDGVANARADLTYRMKRNSDKPENVPEVVLAREGSVIEL